jgi:hypothetical protein
MLMICSSENGDTLGKYNLPAAPAWDRMAVANGKLFISLKDGKLLCLRSENDK